MRLFFYAIPIFFSFVTVTLTGCGEDNAPLRAALKAVIGEAFYYNTTTPWTDKHQWKAEEFFDDPKVIALCKAIEAKNLNEIDRLVADGADVNTRGKGNMTPLLWAFPENKPEVFKRILEHGADPNVVITSHIPPPGPYGIEPGDSVLSFAAGIIYPNYFKYVMQHGGNPNLLDKEGRSPLISVLSSSRPKKDKKEEIQILIDAGADLDYKNKENHTALSTAVSNGCYSNALQLLEAGASFNLLYSFEDNGNTIIYAHSATIVHSIMRQSDERWSVGTNQTPEQENEYMKLIEWLNANGADIEGAKEDIEAYEPLVPGGFALRPARLAELKKRYEDELEAKKAAKAEKNNEKAE